MERTKVNIKPGAGAIITILTDYAKVGYLFIEPKGTIKQESIDEM
jgi:hypothetical protein